MDKEILSCDIVDIIGEYGIQKTRERYLDINGEPFGKIYIWYDICLEHGDGDIVESFQTLSRARKWAREN